MSSPDWSVLQTDVRKRCGVSLRARAARPVAGGCINRCFRVETDAGPGFLKLNSLAREAMFAAEADGLSALADARCVRVPAVIARGVAACDAYLLIEWIEPGAPDQAAGERLGRELAAQHMQLGEAFGWHRDNLIGTSPQHNGWMEAWPGFFAEHRLRPQLQMLAGHSGLRRNGEYLCGRLDVLFTGYAPNASLLHGDLWGGNWLVDSEGRPVLVDPAVHYGDRECDLAMTELFGGFPQSFYAAYQATLPLQHGYATRRDLYQLYHVLNHVNLFGDGYLAHAQQLMQRLFEQV